MESLFEAMGEESGTTVKLSYNLEVKTEVSGGTIKLDYHLKLKVLWHYQVGLPF